MSEKINDVHYSNNTSIEKLIMEQLMRGPTTSKAQATIPAETKLLGVSVKDGICYVNLDSTFLTEGYGNLFDCELHHRKWKCKPCADIDQRRK